MEKLYRLVQAEGFCFSALGVRIGVRTNTPGLLDRIRTHLPPAWHLEQSSTVERLYCFVKSRTEAGAGVRRFHLLYSNAQNIARTLSEEELLEAFESHLNLYIGQVARRRIVVHAGVVGWKGRAIIIPGNSYSGKTTLVKEFLGQGATYYSDEFAVIDKRGFVYPFAKPLAMREETTQRQIKVNAEQLGGSTGLEPLPVGLVLFTRYCHSASWHPRTISQGEGVIRLLANSLAAREQPDRALTFLEKAVQRAQILRGARGEARHVVQIILARNCVDAPCNWLGE